MFKNINFNKILRLWATGLTLLFFLNCTILGIKLQFNAWIDELSSTRAVALANEMYSKRDLNDIKLRARKYSEEVLRKEIIFAHPDDKLLGEEVPPLTKSKEVDKAKYKEYSMLVEATAYWVLDPVEASGDGIAYDGTPAVPYHTIAVDPSVIPLQSEVFVPGVGWCRANDTGNAIKGRIIDVAMSSRDEAWNWGRKLCYVKIREKIK